MIHFFENVWVVTIGGGAAAGLLTWFIVRLFKAPKKDTTSGNSVNNSVVNNVNVNVPQGKNSDISPGAASLIEIAFYKDNSRILFIDDLDLKSKIKNLMSAGWKNVMQIQTADNLDQKDIREAHIIFVDYKGIGPSKEQGLAVIQALRERYKTSKWLILYSAHEVPLNAFNRGADSYLAKNSSVYELEQKIIEGLGKITK